MWPIGRYGDDNCWYIFTPLVAAEIKRLLVMMVTIGMNHECWLWGIVRPPVGVYASGRSERKILLGCSVKPGRQKEMKHHNRVSY
jgi:hypothetical protein